MLKPPFVPENGNVLAVAGRRLSAILLFFGFVCLPGCPSAGTVSDVVTGKVTLGDKPVSGTVTFIGPENKKLNGVAGPDGSYFINNPPKGMYKITVEGLSGAPASFGATAPKNRKDASSPAKDAVTTAAPPEAGTAPPKKYASPDNGLIFEVKGGKQEFNIELKP